MNRNEQKLYLFDTYKCGKQDMHEYIMFKNMMTMASALEEALIYINDSEPFGDMF